MKVLLVWQEIPENTRFFLLEGEQAELAIKAHNCFVNMVDGDPEEAADALNMALEGVTPLDHDAGPIDVAGVSKVVTAGFMM